MFFSVFSDISRPEKLRHEGDSETGSPAHLGYSNPAFEKGEKEPENGGTGMYMSVKKRDFFQMPSHIVIWSFRRLFYLGMKYIAHILFKKYK